MLLHYVHGFTDPQTTVDVWITDCACVGEIVNCPITDETLAYLQYHLTGCPENKVMENTIIKNFKKTREFKKNQYEKINFTITNGSISV